MTLKVCSKCKVDKPVNEFHKNRSRKDGLGHYCKLCARAATRTNYRINPEKMVANVAKWQKANPEKVKAHQAIHRAIKSGKLTKPDACSECLDIKTPERLHGHHHDYSKPLDVIWLCRQCHKNIHI